MKFFLLICYISYISSDCLKFINNQSINECLIKKSTNHNIHIQHYYSECLQCTIQTQIQSENIEFEKNNTCLTIQLQCIQFIFHNEIIFEDFFQSYQSLIYNLFYTNHSTDQNTLHIIIKQSTLEEINLEYINRIFQLQYQAYRVLFFELHIQNQNIKINQNLRNIIRLSIKLILICNNNNNNKFELKQTIYLIDNHQIILQSQHDLCLSIFISSLTTTYYQKNLIQSSSNALLFISHRKSNHIIHTIILLIIFLLCLLIVFIICCLKHKNHYFKSSKKNETTSEDTSVKTFLSLDEKSNLDFKLKQSSSSGIHAIQLIDNDI